MQYRASAWMHTFSGKFEIERSLFFKIKMMLKNSSTVFHFCNETVALPLHHIYRNICYFYGNGISIMFGQKWCNGSSTGSLQNERITVMIWISFAKYIFIRKFIIANYFNGRFFSTSLIFIQCLNRNKSTWFSFSLVSSYLKNYLNS